MTADDPVLLGLTVALALGIRHALEPDHLVALTTLVAGTPGARRRSAAGFGLAWGVGHAVTLVAFGAPVIFMTARLPDVVERGAEFAVGILIVLLAVRVLVRWRRGGVHFHEHDHDGVRHVHVHRHDTPGHDHRHARRTAADAFGIGLVHGTGGSAGATLLVLASAESDGAAVVMLALLAGGAAAAMAAFSGAVAFALHLGRARRHLRLAIPPVSAASIVFGLYYAAGAVAA